MSAFTFSDFLIFSGVTNASEDTYITVAKGVLNLVKAQYGIYIEDEDIDVTMFLSSGQVSVIPKVYPIREINSITYDGDVISSDSYSYYGEDILFDTAVTDTRIPVKLNLSVGFGTSGVPDDLILAVYQHMLAVYYAIDKHTDNISKVINGTGNTTYFNSINIPLASKQTYMFYTGATLLDS